MSYLLKDQDYKNIFYYFEEISSVPRGSGDNQRISDYLVNFAKKHNLEYIQDEALNVIIKREASKGYENCPAVILQGHMDMVCEKTSDTNHDFKKDGLTLLVEGEFLTADRTTLGGDDGIAVAYGLALLSDKNYQGPKLEVLITTDEETGMYGAKALDPAHLTGKYMINVDSEDEDAVLTSCAGGLTGKTTLNIKRSSVDGLRVRLELTGLIGGHSGADIHKNRYNATKLLGRLLFDLRNTVSIDLITMYGGNKDNVIPREAHAEVVIAKENEEVFLENIEKLSAIYKNELKSCEPSFEIKVDVTEHGSYSVLDPISLEKMLFILIHTPNGVQSMSADIKGLVESSLNLGVFHVDEEEVQFFFSIRSSINSIKHFISDKLDYISTFLGAEYVIRGEYPGWEYKKESLLRDLYCKVYKEEIGKEVKVEAIHAGLECGLISEKLPDLDIISVGPNMSGIHTVEEKLSIPSSIRLFKVIEKVLMSLNQI